MKKVIGLVGRAGAGKTTVAKHLMEEFGFDQTAFGYPLKKMLLNAGMCTEEELWGKKTEHSRWLLQKIGTDIFRKQVDPKYWVRKTAEEVHKLLGMGCKVVIDDIRFPEEADLVRSYLADGVLIRLERADYIDATAGTVHESESLADTIPVHHVIRAESGDVKKLLLCIEEIIGQRP